MICWGNQLQHFTKKLLGLSLQLRHKAMLQASAGFSFNPLPFGGGFSILLKYFCLN